MFMLSRFRPATCRTGSRSRRCYGRRASARTLCTRLAWRSRRTISRSARTRGYCETPDVSNMRMTLMARIDRFIVYPRPRTAKRDQPAYKVKSVLKGAEYDCWSYFHEDYQRLIVSLQCRNKISSAGCRRRSPNRSEWMGQPLGYSTLWMSPRARYPSRRTVFRRIYSCSSPLKSRSS